MAQRPVVPKELTHGPFTLIEARRAGLTPKQLRGASWRRIGTGLYVWSGLDDSPTVTLAAVRRRLPAAAVFSGRTAAWLHGLDLPPSDPVEVTIPKPCGVSSRADVYVRRAALSPNEVVERRGMPATSALRTVVDLGRELPPVEAVVVADMALHRRLVTLHAVEAFVAAHPRTRGIARLRRVAELAEPSTESAMETRLRLLLVQAGLPRPEAQTRLADGSGRFLARADLYYPGHRLALEYDGGTHRESLIEDDRRQNRMINAGFRLLRFTAADVYDAPEVVVAQVRAALSDTSAGNSPIR